MKTSARARAGKAVMRDKESLSQWDWIGAVRHSTNMIGACESLQDD
jgi:hypothetical protein